MLKSALDHETIKNADTTRSYKKCLTKRLKKSGYCIFAFSTGDRVAKFHCGSSNDRIFTVQSGGLQLQAVGYAMYGADKIFISQRRKKE